MAIRANQATYQPRQCGTTEEVKVNPYWIVEARLQHLNQGAALGTAVAEMEAVMDDLDRLARTAHSDAKSAQDARARLRRLSASGALAGLPVWAGPIAADWRGSDEQFLQAVAEGKPYTDTYRALEMMNAERSPSSDTPIQ